MCRDGSLQQLQHMSRGGGGGGGGGNGSRGSSGDLAESHSDYIEAWMSDHQTAGASLQTYVLHSSLSFGAAPCQQ